MRNLVIIFLLVVVGAAVLFFYRPVDKLQPNTTPTPSDNLTSGRYIEYSPEAFAQSADQRRVLFFYAAWCPTCRPLDRALQENTSRIPEDVIIFRTNYDTETELKAKYGVTYQHTFVIVDENGNIIDIWNGGDVEEVLTRIQ